MAFTEFYARTGGSNLNAGSSDADAAAFTYADGTFVRSTGVFTVAAGNPLTDGVAVGDFASIYTTAGATVATFVARVTARDAATITVSLTAIAGATSSVSEGAEEATCKVGGAWAGPADAVDFPFDFVLETLMDADSNRPRVNFKGTFLISATIACNTGQIRWEGYHATAGDKCVGGTRPIINGETNNITLLTIHSGNVLTGFDFRTAPTTGTTTTVSGAGDGFYFGDSVITGSRGAGYYYASSNYCVFDRITVHGCASGLIPRGSQVTVVNCTAYNNAGIGISMSLGGTAINCRTYRNEGAGLNAGYHGAVFINCDSYRNADGAAIGAAAVRGLLLQNCNFIANTNYGISGSANSRVGRIVNCGFGRGSMAAGLASGDTTGLYAMDVEGSVAYPVNRTPWSAVGVLTTRNGNAAGVITLAAGHGMTTGTVDIAWATASQLDCTGTIDGNVLTISDGTGTNLPDEDSTVYVTRQGDFTLRLPEARGTGYSGQTDTVSKPDIGAAQRGGTFPPEADVESGVTYGADGDEYTGTLSAGGGLLPTRRNTLIGR